MKQGQRDILSLLAVLTLLICVTAPCRAMEKRFVLRMDESSVPADSRPLLESIFVGLRHDAADAAWSPDGVALATVDSHGKLVIWRDEGRNRQENIGPIAWGDDCLAFLDHGRTLLTAANWDLAKAQSSAPESVAFTVWDLETGSLLRLVDRPPEIIGRVRRLEHCTLSADERLMAVINGLPPYGVAVYSTSDWSIQRTLHLPPRPLGVYVPGALAFSPDGRTLAVGSADKIFLFGLAGKSDSPDVISPYDDPRNAGLDAQIHALAFSRDGRLLASGASGGAEHPYRPVDSVVILTMRDHKSAVFFTGGFGISRFAWSADGQYLVAATSSGVRMFRPLKPDVAPQIVDEGLPYWKAAASSDGHWLAALRGNTITVFDISK